MSAPRQIVPGRFWMVTRRCTQRQFLLRPGERTNAYFEYCLSLAAERTGVRVVAYLAMSNHYHAVVYDPLGTLPVFLEYLNKVLARALNAHWGRWENFWASEAPCVTHLVTAEDVLDKVLYVLANPVVDHLVERVHLWPGANSLAGMLTGAPIQSSRPQGFFRESGPTPTEACLQLVRPPGFEGYSQREWASYLTSRLGAIENQTRTERLAEGRPLLGRKAVLRASAFDSPTTPAPRRTLRPAIACKATSVRIRAIQALMAFRRAYAEAREKLARHQTEVLFPYGTYRMRLVGMFCAQPACI